MANTHPIKGKTSAQQQSAEATPKPNTLAIQTDRKCRSPECGYDVCMSSWSCYHRDA